MDITPTLIIGAVIVLVFAILLLVKLTKNIPPSSQTPGQYDTNNLASEPTYDSNSGFSFGKFLKFLIILAIIIGALYLVFKGNPNFHP